MKIKAVLFDLVGTLIYVKDSVGTVYANSAMKYGIIADPNSLNNCFYTIVENKPKPSGGNAEEKKWWHEVVKETFEKADVKVGESFEVMFENIFKEFSTQGSWGIYPDVVSTLESLKAKGIKCALVSNFDHRLPELLDDLKLSQHFDSLAYSGKVGVSKPSPQIFQSVLDELNIIPEEAVCIGDSLDMDYYPAEQLNINAYLINRTKQEVKGIKTVSNLTQIVKFL